MEDLVIAKMDGTANEVSGLKIQGFPTLLLYPKGDNKKTPIDYGKKSREGVGNFLMWLNENSEVYKEASAAAKAAREASEAGGSDGAAATGGEQEEL